MMKQIDQFQEELKMPPLCLTMNMMEQIDEIQEEFKIEWNAT